MLPEALRDRPARSAVLVALLLALASLPLGHALAFDASAWVVWGREVWHPDLRTGAGPSWKPFPVLFTAPFAVLGDGAGAAWLVVARAGAVVAVVGAARLSARAAGPWAAVVAAGTLLLSPWWLLNGALGNADPILGALVVWGFLAADDDRPRTAFWLGVAGALIRPEAWPFLTLYALWLLRTGRLPWSHALGAGTGVLILWIVPDALSSGLASTSGATGTASAGSAGLTDFPFGTVLVDLGKQAPWIGLAAALAGAAAVVARRNGGRRTAPRGVGPRDAGLRDAGPGDTRLRDAGQGDDGAEDGARGPARPGVASRASRPELWLAVALAYTLLVAVMAQAGFAGNPRYLVPALVLLGAVSGAVVALPDAIRVARAGGGAAAPPVAAPGRDAAVAPPGRSVAAAATAAIVLVLLGVTGAGAVRDQARQLDDRAALRRGLGEAVDEAGGLDAVRRRGPVRSGEPALRSLVAEVLHESVPAASARARPGETVARPLPDGRWRLR